MRISCHGWFGNWKLLEYHFGIDVAKVKAGSEVTFNRGAECRFIYVDDKH